MRDFSLMGIDIGTSTIKVLLWRQDGGFGTVRRPAKDSYVEVFGTGISEQDPTKLWQIVTECIKEALMGFDARTVRGVGLSGHGPSLAAVSSCGNPASNIITWMDPRPVMAADSQDGFRGPSFEATARWIHRRLESCGKGKVRDSLVYMLQPKDYVGFRLTGKMLIDSSAASCMTWFSDNADTGGTAQEDPAAKLFPEAVDPWDALGFVTREASEETGLPAGIPVAAGSIDAFVETLGAGVIESGLMCDSTGTSTCVSIQADDGCSVQVVKNVIPGKKLIVQPVSLSGGCLAWAMSLLFPDVYNGGLDWGETVREALERTEPGASGLVFLPYLVGKRSPVAVPKATGAFLGLRPEHTPYHMLRAVLEGCTYAVLRVIETCKDFRNVTEIRAVGNGAMHSGWLKMKADVLNLPAASMKVKEGTLLGAAILGGLAAKVFGSAKEAVERMVSIDDVFMPDETEDDGYRQGYAAFCKAEEVMMDFWHG